MPFTSFEHLDPAMPKASVDSSLFSTYNNLIFKSLKLHTYRLQNKRAQE